jgi:hypothetical protein
MVASISMTNGTAGRWSGDGAPRAINSPDQQVPERGEVIQGHSDPGSYNFFVVDRPIKQVAGSWSGGGESESSEIAVWMDVKRSVAKCFRDMVGIDYRWLLGAVRHVMPPFFKNRRHHRP